MSRKRPFLTNRRNQVLSFPPFEHRQGQFRDFGWRSALALHYDYNRASKRDEGAPRGRAAIYGCVGNAPRAVIPTAAGIIRIANDSRGERVVLVEHCAQVRGCPGFENHEAWGSPFSRCCMPARTWASPCEINGLQPGQHGVTV